MLRHLMIMLGTTTFSDRDFFNLDKNVVIIKIYGALEIINQAYSIKIIQEISTRQL